jgi:hypothetical protein
VESYCELGNEPSGSIKCWETTERLYNLWPLEWCSAQQSLLCINSDLLSVFTVQRKSNDIPRNYIVATI